MKARSLSKEPLGRVSGFEYESTLETAVDNDAESDVSELVAGKEEQPAGDSSATGETTIFLVMITRAAASAAAASVSE